MSDSTGLVQRRRQPKPEENSEGNQADDKNEADAVDADAKETRKDDSNIVLNLEYKITKCRSSDLYLRTGPITDKILLISLMLTLVTLKNVYTFRSNQNFNSPIFKCRHHLLKGLVQLQ
jgi:hypothetical protein